METGRNEPFRIDGQSMGPHQLDKASVSLISVSKLFWTEEHADLAMSKLDEVLDSQRDSEMVVDLVTDGPNVLAVYYDVRESNFLEVLNSSRALGRSQK